MAYRNDSAALRARIEDLDREAAALREQLGQLSVQLAGVSKEMSALRQRRGVEVTRRVWWAAGAVLAAVAITLGVTYEAVSDAEDRSWRAEDQASQAQSQAINAHNLASGAYDQARQALALAGGPPIAGQPSPPKFEPVVRAGRVESVTGNAPVSEADVCTVTVVSRYGGNDLNCQIDIRCGEQTIYGSRNMGYLICNIEDGRPTFGRDHDPTLVGGDPQLELDLARDRVVVSDTEPDFSVTIVLSRAE